MKRTKQEKALAKDVGEGYNQLTSVVDQIATPMISLEKGASTIYDSRNQSCTTTQATPREEGQESQPVRQQW